VLHLLSDVMFELCVVGMRVTVWPLLTLLPWCCGVFLCLFVFACWTCLVCCVVDRLLFLSWVCLIVGCGLRETHSGLLQTVSDSSTVALFSLVVICDLRFVIYVFRCCCVCVVRCCVAIVGVVLAECGWGWCCWCLSLCGILCFCLFVRCNVLAIVRVVLSV